MYKIFTAYKTFLLQLLLMCIFFPSAFAQADAEDPCDTSSRYLYWTGEMNNDFFNEKNWRITNEKPTLTGTNGPGHPTCFPGGNPFLYSICPNTPDLAKDKYPKENTLDPGKPIRYNLYIESGNVLAQGTITIACAQKGITLINSKLSVAGGTINQGVVSMLNESTVYLNGGKIPPNLTLNFLDAASWVYTRQENPDELQSKTGNITINNIPGTPDDDFRINQYYQKGSVIRPINNLFTALKIFDAINAQGSAAALNEDVIYSAGSIPGGMDNSARSFILKRGYMATFAVNANGTGKSKVYIASETDLHIDALDLALQGNVSFIRVVPWNWVIKKGTGGIYSTLDAGWFYNWNNNNISKPNYEYVPMAWGASGASPAAISQVTQKKKTTHVLGFNESDNCDDQSGQYNNLCQPSVAVAYYENLMGIGVRLGTPAPRENGPTTWLLEFARIAKEKDVRFDFVAVHWYDWGSNPANSPNADPQVIFNRFKSYLQNVHNIYQLPIWITEFNANPNRGNAIQEAFLRLALPYLESLDYVERYAFFQPNSGTANYLDANEELTNIGDLYKNFTSTPSMPEATYACANNLQGLNLPYVSTPVNNFIFEAECGKYTGNQWDIIEQPEASNDLYLRGNNSLAGATSLAKQIHFEFELAEAGSYRAWIRSASTGGAGTIRIGIDGKTPEQISPFTSGSFTWFQVPRFYDLGIGKHRITFEYPNSNIKLDQVALTNGPGSLDPAINDAGYCSPSTLKWGLDATDLLRFYEAELASKGGSWKTQTSPNAIGGAFVASEQNVISADAPDGADKVLTFSVNIDNPDEYDIWAKIQAMKPTSTALWISVDGEPFRKWNNLGNPIFEWYWKKFHYSYGTEDRSFTYFLTAGQHQVKIAIASGDVFVDRLAVATKGKLPETVDPNVLAISENLEFEAEGATILGAASIVNCATSSNGKQVNLFNVNSNGVRFEEIVAETAGTYKLKVSYMSAALRTFRVIVNGVILGKQSPPVSGAWCFNGGSPAIHELDVQLKRGINVIDITPFSGDAPFIDKIQLEKAQLNGLNLEAETALLTGSGSIVNCGSASNGALVNMGLSTGNSIRFNNIIAPETRMYDVDVYYISAIDRNMRYSVNDQPFTTETFTTSGAWCFAGGAPTMKTIQVELAQGANAIEFRPTGSDAPFVDKIVLREVAPGIVNNSVSQKSIPTAPGDLLLAKAAEELLAIYPNPLTAGEDITLSLPASIVANGPMFLQITDVAGRVVFAKNLPKQNSNQLKLAQSLNKGMYFITIIQGPGRISKKIISQ